MTRARLSQHSPEHCVFDNDDIRGCIFSFLGAQLLASAACASVARAWEKTYYQTVDSLTYGDVLAAMADSESALPWWVRSIVLLEVASWPVPAQIQLYLERPVHSNVAWLLAEGDWWHRVFHDVIAFEEEYPEEEVLIYVRKPNGRRCVWALSPGLQELDAWYTFHWKDKDGEARVSTPAEWWDVQLRRANQPPLRRTDLPTIQCHNYTRSGKLRRLSIPLERICGLHESTARLWDEWSAKGANDPAVRQWGMLVPTICNAAAAVGSRQYKDPLVSISSCRRYALAQQRSPRIAQLMCAGWAAAPWSEE